ncbi:hypothetical protein Slin15195_G108590 [Septoria linicola]|uniref:Uncharacterized protein n=1 Tax=Septoria linicola TaxID=215465 RepID=A0A9Q9ENY3_9PEZI|nr:hypothetical protein Slin14017_G106890 [Septoria linicola]USW57540.1 hypothetical protein Slin15195_G108590 [Septoria linicola]
MLGVVVHYCDSCGYNTPVEYTNSVWIQEHTCSHCGSKSFGADVAGESKGAMNPYQHDELAQLFAQLSTEQQQKVTAEPQYEGQARAIIEQLQMVPEKVDAPLTFASAHYTHSTHLTTDTQSEPARSPPPPYRESMMPEAMAEMLMQHSIDPTSLLPNQVELFAGADYDQRLRLLELWRISPPSYPLEQHIQAQHEQTSLEKEEQEARTRYEQQMQVRSMPREDHDFDTFCPESASPVPAVLRPRAASISSGTAAHLAKGEAEPYMSNGYQQMHSDPVYAAGLWSAPSYAQAQHEQSMEDQYGMYEQIRCHADWERMNQRAMDAQLGQGDDMVM